MRHRSRSVLLAIAAALLFAHPAQADPPGQPTRTVNEMSATKYTYDPGQPPSHVFTFEDLHATPATTGAPQTRTFADSRTWEPGLTYTVRTSSARVAPGVVLFNVLQLPRKMIDAPAQCSTCETVYVNETTGKVFDGCHCGGVLVEMAGVADGVAQDAPTATAFGAGLLGSGGGSPAISFNERSTDMGTYRITIEGCGQHHNSLPEDADQIAASCVADLQRAGHGVSVATLALTDGGGKVYEGLKTDLLRAAEARGAPATTGELTVRLDADDLLSHVTAYDAVGAVVERVLSATGRPADLCVYATGGLHLSNPDATLSITMTYPAAGDDGDLRTAGNDAVSGSQD